MNNRLSDAEENTGRPLVESQGSNSLPRDKVSHSQDLHGCPSFKEIWQPQTQQEAMGKSATTSNILHDSDPFGSGSPSLALK